LHLGGARTHRVGADGEPEQLKFRPPEDALPGVEGDAFGQRRAKYRHDLVGGGPRRRCRTVADDNIIDVRGHGIRHERCVHETLDGGGQRHQPERRDEPLVEVAVAEVRRREPHRVRVQRERVELRETVQFRPRREPRIAKSHIERHGSRVDVSDRLGVQRAEIHRHAPTDGRPGRVTFGGHHRCTANAREAVGANASGGKERVPKFRHLILCLRRPTATAAAHLREVRVRAQHNAVYAATRDGRDLGHRRVAEQFV
jgi:hypothetical protein